jgi:hypothetical protein
MSVSDELGASRVTANLRRGDRCLHPAYHGPGEWHTLPLSRLTAFIPGPRRVENRIDPAIHRQTRLTHQSDIAHSQRIGPHDNEGAETCVFLSEPSTWPWKQTARRLPLELQVPAFSHQRSFHVEPCALAYRQYCCPASTIIGSTPPIPVLRCIGPNRQSI